MLPKDICIESINLVSNESHARFDAVSRSYEYVISNEKNLIISLHITLKIILIWRNE